MDVFIDVKSKRFRFTYLPMSEGVMTYRLVLPYAGTIDKAKPVRFISVHFLGSDYTHQSDC